MFRHSGIIYSPLLPAMMNGLEKNHAKMITYLWCNEKAGRKFSHDIQTEPFPRGELAELSWIVVPVYWFNDWIAFRLKKIYCKLTNCEVVKWWVSFDSPNFRLNSRASERRRSWHDRDSIVNKIYVLLEPHPALDIHTFTFRPLKYRALTWFAILVKAEWHLSSLAVKNGQTKKKKIQKSHLHHPTRATRLRASSP